MDFQLSERRQALQQAVREFAEKELLPGVIERDEKSEYPLELYKKLGSMGYVGLPYEEKYGGSGGDYLDYALCVEEISKVDASLGISYSVAMSLYAAVYITEPQKSRRWNFCRMFSRERRWAALA